MESIRRAALEQLFVLNVVEAKVCIKKAVQKLLSAMNVEQFVVDIRKTVQNTNLQNHVPNVAKYMDIKRVVPIILHLSLVLNVVEKEEIISKFVQNINNRKFVLNVVEKVDIIRNLVQNTNL